MAPLRIDEIEFVGSTDKVKVPRIILFVGPNGSGKTHALHEIHALLKGGPWTAGRTHQIVKNIQLCGPKNKAELLEVIQASIIHRVDGDPDNCWVLACSEAGEVKKVGINLSHFDDVVDYSKVLNNPALRTPLMDAFLTFPRLETLTACLQPKKLQIFSRPDVEPVNLQQIFLRFPERADKVNAQLQKVFKKTVCLVPSNNSDGSFVIANKQPPDKLLAFNPTVEMQKFYSECSEFQRLGDGFRMFASLVTLIYATDHKLLLLDEPEIYLHAPLVRRLAANLIEEFSKRDGTIVAATHSSDFIAGCLAATDDVAIVRTTYSEDLKRGTVNVIEHDLLKRFVNNPVLRNIDALPGLFYEAVIVVEGQGDKVVYSEVNRRLNDDERGIRDAFFISATGKTNLSSIAEPFFRSGIPTVVVCDFDIFKKESVKNLKRIALLYQSASDAEVVLEIDEVIQVLHNYEPEKFKQNGINALAPADKATVSQLLTKLMALGIFIVPFGELESWYRQLGITWSPGDKDTALNLALEKIADSGTGLPHDLSSPYSSLWAFVRAIAAYVNSHTGT